MKPAATKVYQSLALWREARVQFDEPSIGFVPTMGALHSGHGTLLRRARAENDRVVLSIFVNPTQFNDPADFAKYPQALAKDLAMVAGVATDVILPTAKEMYPDDYRFRVQETKLSQELEGAQRPGHFEGMLTIVLKLLNVVQPHRAYFGTKDWQQLQLVRDMAAALLLPVEIIACSTVREDDGLAMSSRNARLSEKGRIHAAHFSRILREAPNATAATLELKFAGFEVDYVEDRSGVRLGAVRLEGVRLIDNVPL